MILKTLKFILNDMRYEVLPMSELVVEYLYFSKKELHEEISGVFRKSISPYIVNSKLECEVQGEKLMCDYDIVLYNDSLRVVFKYGKWEIGAKEANVRL